MIDRYHKSIFTNIMPITTTWLETAPAKKDYPALNENIETDVAIIGGGLAGILSAYTLSKAGKRVVILEAEQLLRQDTAYTTAFITEAIDTPLRQLTKMFGDEKAKLAWNAGHQAIGELEKIIKDENIECEYQRCPIYMFAQTEKEYGILAKEMAAMHQLGIDSSISKNGLDGFGNIGALTIPGQAKFHPLKFAQALAEILEKSDVKIFENSKVLKIDGTTAMLDQGSVHAENIIVATQMPFNKPKVLRFKKALYDTYVFELHLPKETLKEALYVDTKNPYHYFRVDAMPEFDRLIIGGEDHRKDIPIGTKKNFVALIDYVKKLLPGVDYKIAHRWSGPIPETLDGLPFIGEYEKNQYLAGAFSGNGMTYSMISAILLRDLITGKENPWTALYDPKRWISLKKMTYKGFDYMEEFYYGALKNFFGKKDGDIKKTV